MGAWTALRTLVVFAFLAVVTFSIAKMPRFQLMGPLVYRANTSAKCVALTFDDGPSPPHTQEVFSVLDRHGAKATFFVIGQNIERHPGIAREIHRRGHKLANHSYTHQPMVLRSPSSLREEITRTDYLIRKSGQTGEIHFRPPHGLKLIALPKVLSELNKTTVTWDITPQDYRRSAPEWTADYVLSRIQPGSIVLLHDKTPEIARATDLILSTLEKLGFRAVTVSTLMSHC